MTYFLGLLSGVVFIFVLIGTLYLGYRFGHKKSKPPDIDEDKKREMKQLNDDFKKLMGYNERIALQRKKV